jgi:hypothetical protein
MNRINGEWIKWIENENNEWWMNKMNGEWIKLMVNE